MRAAVSGVEVVRGCADGFLGCAEVVDGGVKAHVGFEIDALFEVEHDPVDAPFKEAPRTVYVIFGGGERRWL